MIKKLIFMLFLLSAPMFAAGPTYVSYTNWCYQGGLPTMVQGMKSSTLTQTSFPTCQVTVYVHGDGLATLYSDKAGTPLSNPFTATSNGQFEFYVDTTLATEYDVTMTGGTPAPGFPSPVTYADVFIGGGGGGGGGGPGACEIQGANPGDICYFNGTNWIILPGNATTVRVLSETSGTPSWQAGGVLACQGVNIGDICYFTGSAWTVLPGNVSTTQYLTENAGVPSWQAATGLPSGTGVVRVNSSVGSAAELSGDATTTSSNLVTVKKINGTALSGLATGILKNTTGTGVPSIAASSDVIGLFTGCSGTQYLGADGACHPSSGGVSSIQPQNNGVNYGSAQTGAVTMNFANCTVSATFTITCPTGVSVAGSSGDLQMNNGSGNLAASHINDNGTTIIGSEPVDLGSNYENAEYYSHPETAGSGGVSANTLVTFDTSNPSLVITAPTNATGVLGITATAGLANSGVRVVVSGDVNCIADNNITAGDLVGVASTTAGRCKDLGVTTSQGVTSTTQIVGKAEASGTTGNPVLIHTYGAGHYGTLVVAASANTSICGDNSCTQLFTKPACADSSGSGTVQVCNTSPTFVPSAGSYIIYTTTTANTGDVTVNVNSLGAKHIRKNLGAAVLVSGDLPANVNTPLYYDGTYWEILAIGNSSSGGLTSVGLTMPAEFSVSNSPLTSNGTIAVSKQNETAGYIYKTPPSSSQSGYVVAYTKCDLASSSSQTCTLNQPTSGSGHALIAIVSAAGPSVTAVTDSASNSYTQDATDNNYTYTTVYRFANVGSGVTSVTATISSPRVAMIHVLEVANLNTSTPFDVGSNQDFSACTPPAVLSPITTANATDFIISVASSASGTTYSAGTGYVFQGQTQSGFASISLAEQYVNVTNTGTYTPSIGCSSGNIESVTVSYKTLTSPGSQQPSFQPNFITDFNYLAIGPIYDHSGTFQNVLPHTVADKCTLGSSCSVTLTGNSVFTSSTSYQCVCSDQTSAAACKFAPSSGSAFALTGTGTDVLSYICVGN